MICQLHCSIKNLYTIFSILGNNVANIRLNCCKLAIEDEYVNRIKLISTGYILEKRKYNTEIVVSSINTYSPDDEKILISYEPGDSWNACCEVFQDKKDLWIPSTLQHLINMFPDEYIGEIFIKDDGRIVFIVKDSLETLFDNKNIMAKFLI